MNTKTDEQLMRELEEAARGLLLMSESDHPLEVFRLEGDAKPTHDHLRALSEQDSHAPVEERSAADVFRAAASEPDWKRGEELETARRFQRLLRLLEDNLTELSAYRVGEINMPVFIVGRAPSGNYIGLKTRVVET